MSSAKKEGQLAFSLYLLLAGVMTWPLLGRLPSQVPMGVNDLWQSYWNLWWWKLSLLQGQSPYFTAMLLHPDGAPLGLHTHSPATMLLTLPVNLLFGMAPAYNLAIFFGFVLAGFGGFLLAREYTRSSTAAFLAGITAAYFPQHVERSLEHVNLASYWALPLFLWALVRSVRHGGKWWIATGFFFALNALFSWHNGLMAISLGLVLVLYESWRGPRPITRLVFELGLAAILAAFLLAPFAWPLIRDSRAGVASVQRGFQDRSIDPASLLVPHAGHPLWGSVLTHRQLEIRRYPAVGGLAYVGWATLALTALIVLAARRRSWGSRSMTGSDPPTGSFLLWLSLFLFFLLMSFGESLESRVFVSAEGLRLPFYWLKSIPLFGLIRLPNRFFVPAMLSLAVAMAVSVDVLLRQHSASRRHLIGAACALLLVLDYAWLPYPTRDLPRPSWVGALDDLPADLAVLDITSSHRGSGGIDMYYQTLHERPIVSGYVSANLRTTARRFREHPQLRRIFIPLGEPELDPGSPSLVDSIRQLDTGIVVVHLERTVESETEARLAIPKGAPNYPYQIRRFSPQREISVQRLKGVRSELLEAFGNPVYRDGEVEIYLVR
jgi:hypothetical protein